MREIIRPLPIYMGGRKIGQITKGKYDIESGDEQHVGNDGVLGHSHGTTTTKVSATMVQTVGGSDTDAMDDALLKKKYVQIGIPKGRKIHQIDMRVTRASYDWDWKSGNAAGDFELQGGEPDVTG